MAPRLIAVAMMTLALAGESPAADVPAPSAEYQAALDAALAPGGELLDARIADAVAVHRRESGLDEIHAKIAVHRDLASRHAGRKAWGSAVSYLSTATSLAGQLEEPELLLATLVEYARYQREANDVSQAWATLKRAGAIIAALDRPEIVIEHALLRIELLDAMQIRADVEAAYAPLLGATGVDQLRVEHHRARHTKPTADGTPGVERWTRTLELARAAGRRDIEAEASDSLGHIHLSLRQYAEAANYYAAAEALGVPLERRASHWLSVVEANTRIDNRPAALQALGKAFSLTDPLKDPGRGAALHEARGELRARAGDFPGAYEDLKTANELRARHNAERQSFPMVRMAPNASVADKAAATELATVRSALREAELERTRLRTRQTAGIATVAGLVAALLALGFAYQRRSAAAHASGRHAAELKAERTHWQMLRYQLSPHFLFNALTSLSGLVVTDPPAARRVVDRLSEFCQLALAGARDSLRTVAQEAELVRAYLDVEQAGAGDDLRTSVHIAPPAAERMIPPLLLQPLVENALKYGGQTSPDVLQVTVEASVDPATNELILEVANTGQWLEKPATSGRESIGLANVRQRLQQVGASPAALAISSAAGWVRVTIRLPALAGTLAAAAP